MIKINEKVKRQEDTPEAGSPLPVLYRKIEPLSPEGHGGLMLSRPDGYGFAAGTNVLPVAISEFIAACLDYPIVFTGQGKPVPIAVVGARNGENQFVGPDGRWEAGRHVPAYVHRHPFIFMRSPDESQLILCIDPTSERLARDGKGEPLFIDGQPGAIIREAMTFMSKLQEQYRASGEFAAALDQAGLLVMVKAEFTPSDGGAALVLDGVRVVDEKKYRELPDDLFLEWRRKGWLDLIHAHLLSLANWKNLGARAAKAA